MQLVATPGDPGSRIDGKKNGVRDPAEVPQRRHVSSVLPHSEVQADRAAVPAACHSPHELAAAHRISGRDERRHRFHARDEAAVVGEGQGGPVDDDPGEGHSTVVDGVDGIARVRGNIDSPVPARVFGNGRPEFSHHSVRDRDGPCPGVWPGRRR